MFLSCRYALLRRRLLMDPHILNDDRDLPTLFIDNPLSKNPGYLMFMFPWFTSISSVDMF